MAAGSELLRAFATLELRGAKDVERGLASVESKAADTERTLSQKVGGSLKSLGGSLTSAGKNLTTFATLPLAAAGAGMFKLASDAEESASKMQAVFGPATGEMNRWIEGLRETVPATTAELQGMSSGIQDLLVPLGMAPKEAQNMTQEVVTLAADLASFNNIPMDEALEKIRSGLVGQNEPLLDFGVAINAAAVETKALEMGLISEGQELDANARAQATFQLIQEKTTAAHGDAAKTASSSANSLKFLWSEAKEAATVLGQNLLPILTPIIEKLGEWAGKLTEMSPRMQMIVLAVGAFAAAIGPVLVALGMVATGIGAILPLLPALGIAFTVATGPIGIAIAAIAAGAFLIYKNWGPIKGFFIGLWNGIKTATQAAWNGIKTAILSVWALIGPTVTRNVEIIKTAVSAAWNVISATTKRVWNGIKVFFGGIWNAIKSLFKGNSEGVKAGMRQAWEGIKQVIQAAWRGVVALLKTGWATIKALFRSSAPLLKTILQATWNAIKAGAKAAWNGIKALLQAAWDGIKAAARAAWNGFKAVLRGVWNAVTTLLTLQLQGWRRIITAAWNTIKSITQTVWNAIRSFLESLWSGMTSAITAIREKFQAGIRRGWEWIKSFTTGLFNAVRDFFVNLWQKMTDRVTSIRETFQAGIRRGWEWIRDFSIDLFTAVGNKVTDIWTNFTDRITSIRKTLQAGIRKGWEWLQSFTRDAWEAIGGFMWRPIEAAWGKIREWINKIIDLVNPILKKVGIDEIGHVGGGGGAPDNLSTGRGTQNDPRGLYTGGVIGPGEEVIVGDRGQREYVINPARRDNFGLLDEATREMERRHRRRGGQPARGKHRAGALGGTHHNVYDYIRERAEKITSKFPGTSWNTYTNHITTPPANEHSTIDIWGGQRGTPVGTDRGHQVKDFVISNLSKGLIDMAWDGTMYNAGGAFGPIPAPYANHWDHNHIAWSPDPNAEIVSGGGGSGTGGPSWQQRAFEMAWNNTIQPVVDRFLKPMKSSSNVMTQVAGGLAAKVPEGIKKWVQSKLGTSASQVTGNFSGDQKAVALEFAKNAKSRGMPGRLPVMTALQESGMRNLDYGDRDSLGYFQQRPSQGWGTPEQIRDPAYALGKFLDAAEPFKGQYSNTATGLGAWAQAVQRSAFPDLYAQHWDAAAGLIGDPKFYGEGGVAIGPQLMALAEEGAQELVIPLKGKGAQIARDALQIGDLRAEMAGLRADLRDAGIKISDIEGPAAKVIEEGQHNGAERFSKSRSGSQVINKSQTKISRVSQRKSGG